MTGLFLDQPSIAGKWIELLREVAPNIERLAILWDANTGADQLEVAKAVAQAKGFEVAVLEAGTISNYDEALRVHGGRSKDRHRAAEYGQPGTSESEGLATAARKHQLPTTTFHKSRLHSGMLMSYGLIQEVYYPRVLMLAERILKGEKPGELPIERPDRFESVINLKTAKALGITIPRSAVARGRGDRMIDSSRCRFFEFGDTPKIQRRKKLAACGIARSRRCSQACPTCSGCPCKPAC